MINPILKHEMKTSSRRLQFYISLMIYLLIVAFPILVLYKMIYEEQYVEAQNFQQMYLFTVYMQGLILMFMIPALTASSITGEREKQTLDILLTTKMTPLSIILGKLFAAVSRVILLMLCTLPVYAVVLFLGGIQLSYIIEVNLYFIVNILFIGSICLFISVIVKTTKIANVIAYFIEFALIIGWPIITVILIILFSQGYVMQQVLAVSLMLNPLIGLQSLLGYQVSSGGYLMLFLDLYEDINVPVVAVTIISQMMLSLFFIWCSVKRLKAKK